MARGWREAQTRSGRIRAAGAHDEVVTTQIEEFSTRNSRVRLAVRAHLHFPSSHKVHVLSLCIATALSAHGQTPLNLTGPSYTQNFDGTGSLLPVGWGFGQNVTFAGTTISSTQAGGTTGAGILSGSSAAGAYHFTNGTLGTDTDRSIGYITSGSFSNNRDILFAIRNTTGQYITALTLTFDYEKYRSGISSRDWAFFASASDISWGSAFASGAQSYAADLNSTTVFHPPQSVTKSVTIGALNIAPEANYFFRWNYYGTGTGSGAQALGLDNLLLSSTLVGGILYWDTNGALAGLGGSGAWDAAAMNWNIDSAGTAAPSGPFADREVVFSGTGGTVTIGSGMAANAGITFASSGYTLTGSPLALGGVAPATITVTNGIHTATVSAAISGSAGLRKSGAGKLTLAGASSFTGGTTIAGGVLEVGADSNLGAASGAVALSGGKLKTTASFVSGRALSGSGSIDVAPSTTLDVSGATAAGDIVLSNTGTLRLSGVAPSVSSITIESPGELAGGSSAVSLGGAVTTSNTSGTAVISTSLNLGNVLRTFTIADGLAGIDLLISGNLTGTGSGRLLKLGAGTLSLTGTNSGLLGGVQLGTSGATGGVLVISKNSSLGSGTFIFHAGRLRADAPLAIAAPIEFGGSGTSSATFEGSAIAFQGTAQLSGADAHTIVADSAVTISGALSGSSPALTIRGAGSVTLENGGSFTGNVTVDGGDLFVTGGLTAATRPSISVTQSGLLGGNLNTGTLGALIATMGTLSPGTAADATGTLVATASGFALDVQAGGSLTIQIGGVGDNDTFTVTGQVRLAGDLLLSIINGFTPSAGSVFTIVSNDSTDAVSGTFTGKPNGAQLSVASSVFSINYAGGDGNDVTLTTVPEPMAGTFMLAGLAILALRRRR